MNINSWLRSFFKRKTIVRKSDDGQQSIHYLRAFKEKAKAMMPNWQYGHVHQQARGAAGGKTPRVGTLAPYQVGFSKKLYADISAEEFAAAWLKENGHTAVGWDEDDNTLWAKLCDGDTVRSVKLAPGITARMGKKQDEASPLEPQAKSMPRASLHVPVPLGSDDDDRVRKESAEDEDLMLAMAAMDIEAPPLPDDLRKQRLVAGIDVMLRQGDASTVEEAKTLAEAVIDEDPDRFGEVAVADLGSDAVAMLDGFDLHLGSGAARYDGCFGIDTLPYDYATIVHDLSTGIPFRDKSVRSVRLINALNTMTAGGKVDPLRLFTEIERVLMPGGQFLYEGAGQLSIGPDWDDYLPGLVQVQFDAPEDGSNQVVRQRFVRQDHAASSQFYGQRIPAIDVASLPLDVMMADAVMQDLLHMSDLPTQPAPAIEVGKADGAHPVPILKKDAYRQIVFGVVLSPNEIDTQDDYMQAKDIEEAAHKYLEQCRVVGTEHTGPIKAVPVESYIAPQDLNLAGQNGPQLVKKGSWVLGVKILDAQEWQKVLSGDYTGFSVGGFGLRDKT